MTATPPPEPMIPRASTEPAADDGAARLTGDGTDGPGAARIDLIGALAFGLLALVLALHEIGRWPFWHDEAYSVDALGRTWQDLVDFATSREINMATYYALLKAWTSVAMTDAWIRSLSAIFAALAVVAVFGLARSLFGRRVAWMAAAILVLDVLLLRYAQETRAYALTVLLAVLSTWALVRAVRSGGPGRWTVYVVLAALLPYTHLVLVALYPVHVLAVLTARPRPHAPVLLAVAIALGVAIAPALALAAQQQAGVLGWIPPTTVPGLARAIRSWLGGGGSPGPLETAGVAASLQVLPVVFGGLAVVGVLTAWRSGGQRRWAGVVVAAWASVPIVLAVAVSIVRPFVVIRYLLYVTPAAAILIAVGIAAVPRRWAQITVLGCVLALGVNATLGYYGGLPRPDWRSATAWVVARSTADDRVVYIGDFGRVLPYYARQSGAADRIPVVLGSDHGLDFRSSTYPQDLAHVGRLVAAHDRVLWVVSVDPPLLPPDRDPRLAPLGQVMRLDASARFDGIVVTRYVPRSRAR